MNNTGDSLLDTFDSIIRPYVLQCTGRAAFQTMTATSFRTKPICTARALPSPPGCRRSARLAPFASLVLFAIKLVTGSAPVSKSWVRST
jgi:hypothetical protein